jgi:hypothetical protein
MATRTISRTDLVGVAAVSFIRPVSIAFSVTDTKPNTKMYPFFDGRPIDDFITPTGGSIGGALVTSASGTLSGTFHLPPMTFNTGRRAFRLQEVPEFENNSITGNTYGFAEAEYTTAGIRNTLRETITTITDEIRTTFVEIAAPAPAPWAWSGNLFEQDRGGNGPGDPLAQSFFTYGMKGGMFVTSIDLFFQTKDVNIPVVVEIRELVNGTPGSRLATPFSRKSLPPSAVNLSNDALAATTFTFPSPVYLAEDKDWCFVILSNSNSYNCWTAKISERSVETGAIIFDQPFIGSLFKSENNITWTAEQFEDIKFTIKRAKFVTSSPATITYAANTNSVLVFGTQMSVTSGSPVVTFESENQHGLRTGDYISLTALPNGVYRGITAVNLTGNFVVTKLSDYKITFIAGSNATSTGTLATAGLVNEVVVDNGGSNYAAPVLTFTGSGTGAAATATLLNGSIVGITMTNKGTGYLSAPSLTITDATGTGVVFAVIAEAMLAIAMNNSAHVYRPNVTNATLPDTKISTTIRITDNQYGVGQPIPIVLDKSHIAKKSSLVVNSFNELTYLPGLKSSQVVVSLSSTNDNTSPIVSVNEPGRLQTTAYVINNQTSAEDLTAVYGSSGVATITVTAGGSGYGAPTVVIGPPDFSWGTQATATAVMGAGAVASITVTVPGSGYISRPSVTIVGANTTPAAAQAVMNPFNTELLPTGGTAYSKYLTKPITLQTVSKGVRLFVTASSTFETAFDVYIRTSLASSGIAHKTLGWSKLECDTETNLSKNSAQFLDYTFNLDGIPEFDVYDLKIVMRSTNAAIIPRISNYRTIIIAT